MKKLTLVLSMMLALVGLNTNAAMYLVGGAPFGEGWDPSKGVEMTDNGDGTYTFVSTVNGAVYFCFADNLAAAGDWNTFNGSYRFGPVLNGADQTINAGEWTTTQRQGNGNGSYKFTGTGEEYTVTFDLNNLQFKIEGEVGQITYNSLTVAGSNEAIFGTTWDPTNVANDMTLANGLYTFTKNNVELAAGAFEFKVVADHDTNYGAAWPANNYYQQVPVKGIYNVAITFDPSTEAVACELTLVEEIPDTDVHTYTVAGNSEALFGTTWDETNEDNNMTLTEGLYTFTKSNVELTAGDIEFKVVQDHNWNIAYPSENWKANIAANGIYDVTITFNETTKDITFEAKAVEETEDFYTVAGSPAAIFGEEWNAANAANNMIAGEDGIYTWTKEGVELTANTKIEFKVVKNANWNTCWPESNYEYTVTEDGTYDLLITFNPAAEAGQEVTFTATKQGGEEPVEDTYTVAGTQNLFGSDWDPADEANNMVKGEDGIYTWTKTGVEFADVDTIEFKVVKNHSWDVASYPENNWWHRIATAGTYDFVITFNPAAEAGQEITFTATKQGGEEPVEMVYTVVGPESVFGSNWNPADEANNMVKGEDGVYTWTKEEVTLYGNFEFKVVGNHDYAVYEWPMGPNNWVANLTEGEGVYTVAITFNPEAADSVRIACTLTKTADITPVEHTYTVAGTENLFGSNWNQTDEANDMVKGEDGIYTWTKDGVEFAAEAVVEFKVVQDHAWDYAWPSSNWWWQCTEDGTYNVVITFDPAADDMNKITFTATKVEEPAILRGDVNQDNAVNITDVTSLINLLLKGGEKPAEADCNVDDNVNITDVTTLINYLLKGQW